MNCSKFLRSLLCLILCVTALTACFMVSARERTLECGYRKITENGFVADTFCGVEARYNLSGRTLYCTELIERYCREVYGLTVRCSNQGPMVQNSDEYWFEETDQPVPGDVLYGSAAARSKGYNHWAIVKSVDPERGTMTLFEQNWRWNGCAGVDRMIPYTGSCYTAFHLETSVPQPEPPQPEPEQPEMPVILEAPLVQYALQQTAPETGNGLVV